MKRKGWSHRLPRFFGVLEELESRLLFNADLVALSGLDPLAGTQPASATPATQETATATPTANETPAATTAYVSTQASTQVITTPVEIVFVDRGVKNAQDLIADIVAQQDGSRTLEIHWLDSEGDGAAQITETLQGRGNVAALHLLSHGRDGMIQLGSTWLSRDNLSEHAADVAAWGLALTTDADLMVYGCDVAASDAGRSLLSDIALLTGADVAGSSDATGSSDLGGDWTLEFAQGQIESQNLVAAPQAMQWQGLLAINPAGGESVVNTTTTGAQATTNAHQVAMNANGGYVVIWNQSGTIKAKLFDSAGNIVKDEFTVATGTSAKVAMNDAGTFVVTWLNSAGDVVFQRYDSGGTAQGGVTTVVSFSTNGAPSGTGRTETSYTSPDVAITNTGEFIVVYSEQYYQDYSAFYVEYTHTVGFKAYTAAGAQQGSNGNVTVFSVSSNTYGRSSAGNSAIGLNTDTGKFTIAWTSGGATTHDVVSARSYTAARASSGSTFQVNTTASGATVTAPVVAVNNSGQAVIAWTRTASSNSDIYFRRATGTGAGIGSQTMAHASATNNQTSPSVAVDPDSGQFSIVYQDSSGSNDVYMSQYASDGTSLGSSTIVNTTTAGSQTIPSVARNGNMGVVIWTGPSTTTDVYAQRFVGSNAAPSLTATSANPSFTEGAGQGVQAAPVNVYSGAVASTIEGSQTVTSLTFTVSGLVDGANESIVVDGTTITLGANSSGTTATNGMSYTVTISSGTATVALTHATGVAASAISTLVNNLTYQNTIVDMPTAGNRVFTLTQIKDNGGTADGGIDTTTLAIVSTVAVVARNDGPTVSSTALSPTFTEAAGLGTQAAAVSVFSGTAVGTVESGQSITSLTFTVGGIANGASERIVVDGTTITLGANSSGTTATNGMSYTVTINSGTATVTLTKAAGITTAAAQTLVDGLTYQNTSTDSPTAGNRTFTLTQIKDSGGSANGGTDTSTLSIVSVVNVVAVNDAPSLTTTASNPTFTEAAGAGTQAAAVNIFSGTAASAVEASQTLTSLTFTISGIVDGANERIAVDGVTLTLGANSSGTTATNAMGYTVTISSDTATVTLTKAAGITTAAMQTLVNGITYQNISTDNPTAGARTFTLTQIKDNGGTANGGNDTTTLSAASTVTVVARNDAPTLTATASNPTFTEAAGAGTQANAVSVFSGATASTVETGQNITSLTFTVSGLVDGANERITVDGSTITLGANSSGTTTTNGMSYTVTISSGTATVVLTKAAGISAAATQTLVNGITYQNTHTDSPTAGNRVFTFTQIKDDGGTANGGSDTTTLSFASTVAVVARNDAPTLTTTAANPTFTEAAGVGTQAAAVAVFGSTAVSTVESGQSITSLTFTVGGIVNGASERIVVDGSTITLGANSSGTTATHAMSYTVTLSSGTATVVLTKAAGITAAATQTLVDGITYQNTSTDNPTAGNRTFTLTQIKDSGGTANGGSDTTTLTAASTVTVVARNDAPTLTATGSNPTFTEAAGAGTQAAAVTLYSGTAISTVESGQTLTSLTFTVSGLVDGANERITVDGTALTLGTNSSGTTATHAMSYSVNVSGGTATIVLTKGAGISAAAMQTLVNGITYQNTSTDNPTAGSRVITLTQVKDSGGSANGGSDTTALSIASTVNVVAANDAPVAVNDVVTIEVNTTADITVTSNDSDADNATASLTVTIVSYSGGIVSATVNGDGTLHVVTGMSTGNETIVYYLTDGNGAQSGNATVNVTISASPPPSGTDASTTLVEDNSYTFTDTDFGFVPVNVVQTFDGIQVVNVPTAGTLKLNGVTLIDGDVVSAAQIAAGQLVYTPATDGSGTPYTSFTFQVRDNFGTYAASTNTFTVDVTAVNDAPVLVNAIDFLAITEDDVANSGQLVSTLINSSDAENGSTNGVAVHGLSSGRGTWQYSTDGGGSWTSIAAASDSSALLLRGSDYLRFVPDGDNADAATIDVYAWDGTTGSAGNFVDVSSRGGTTAFSLASDTASLAVTAVNDAPVLTGSGNFAGITEDQTNGNGQLVSSLLTSTDVDTGAQQGIVISAVQSGNGNWQYSLDGGASWTNVGAVSDSAALLLADTDRIRFVPDGIDADAASITFHAWDQSSGTAGSKVSVVSTGGTTAFSTASATASIAVSALNDAPVITGTSDFIAISEDATGGVGQLVSSLVATSDVDDDPATGVAIHSQNAGNGTWQYSVDGGSTWSNVTGLSDATALLLRGSDRLRFLPDGLNADAPTLSFYAWDQTTGTAGTQADASTRGGTTAFSSVDGTSQMAVTAVNDAPILTGTQPFTPITEDSVNNAGQLVSSLITTTDVDSAAVNGVAIYGQSAGNGTWQYSTDGGTSWNSIGSVTGNAALLLGASDRLRFIPDGHNADAASLSYYAWDQSTGTAGSTADVSTRGGTTAFSTAAGTSTITVTAVNDAPMLSASHDFTGITEDDIGNPGQLVSSLLDVTDVDTGAATGVAIYGQTVGNGRWQFSTDGGSSWTDLGSVAGNAARLLRGTDHLRFVPDGLNADAASLSFYAWDQSSGSAGSLADASTRGGTTAFSLTGGSSAITVSAVNDAPVITGTSNLVTIDEDQINNNGQLVSSLYTATDVDTGALTGIAIDGTSSSYGQWQYSTDGGLSWSSVGAVSDSSALLLRHTDRVRFVPDGFNGETATLSFRAWDQSTGSAGARADVSSPGGASAFSASSTTSSLTITGVNEAPVLSGANNFNTVLEDDVNNVGTRVTSLLGTFLSDVDDADQPGLAITAVDNSHGTWQYTTDGVTWLNVGNVSTGSARLLTGDSVSAIRFVPDADWTGTASITFQAWDGTSGTPGGLGDASVGGGTSAFSTASATSNLMVFAVNDAPVLTGSSDFTGISEDDTSNATNPGRLVSSLFGSTDVDSGAVSGVAVYAQTGSHGKWQYSADGNTWQDLGAVSSSSAMLLRSTDYLRFLPDGSRGTNASLSVYAWDQDSGTAGSTADVSLRGGANAFSTASGTTHIAVSDVNDTPVMSAITLSASAVPFTSWTTATLLDQAVDADGDVLSVGIVTGPSHGTLVQQPDGSWRYEGAIGYVGPDTFSYRAVDAQSQSVVIRTVQIDVVNPVLDSGGGQGADGTGSGGGAGSGAGNAGGDRPSAGNGGNGGSNGSAGQDNTGGAPSWPDLGPGTDDEGDDASQGGGPLSITEMIERIRSNANLGQISQELLSGGRGLGLTPAYANFMQGGMATGGGSVMQLLELIKSNLALTGGDIDLQITPLNTVSHALPLEGTRPSHDAPGGGPIPTISLTKAASYSTGLGLSIGTIWWTARISGLLTSALISTPAWRSLDPLPVVTSPHDDDPDQGGAGHGSDGDPDKDVEHLFDADRPMEAELPVIE